MAADHVVINGRLLITAEQVKELIETAGMAQTWWHETRKLTEQRPEWLMRFDDLLDEIEQG